MRVADSRVSTNAIRITQEETQNRAKQLEDATKQLAKSEKQIAKLKSDLEAERARVRPASPQVSISSATHGIRTQNQRYAVRNQVPQVLLQ